MRFRTHSDVCLVRKHFPTCFGSPQVLMILEIPQEGNRNDECTFLVHHLFHDATSMQQMTFLNVTISAAKIPHEFIYANWTRPFMKCAQLKNSITIKSLDHLVEPLNVNATCFAALFLCTLATSKRPLVE